MAVTALLLSTAGLFAGCGDDKKSTELEKELDEPQDVTYATPSYLPTGWYESGDFEREMDKLIDGLLMAGDYEELDRGLSGRYDFVTAYRVKDKYTIEGVVADVTTERPDYYFKTRTISYNRKSVTLYYYYRYPMLTYTYTFTTEVTLVGENGYTFLMEFDGQNLSYGKRTYYKSSFTGNPW
jgi:hypothetical protein